MPESTDTSNPNGDLLKGVNMEVRVSVGRSYPSVGELIHLKPDSVLPLDQSLSDPVELLIGNKVIARGHIEEASGSETGELVVRVTAVGDPMDSLK